MVLQFSSVRDEALSVASFRRGSVKDQSENLSHIDLKVARWLVIIAV